MDRGPMDPDDRDRKVRKIVDDLKDHVKSTEKETISQIIHGNNNTQIIGNPTIVEKKVERPRLVVTPPPGSISSAQKKELHDWVGKLVEASIAAGTEKTTGELYSEYWNRFKKRFRVSAIDELAAADFDQALTYVKRLKALNKTSAKRKNPAYWRTNTYAAIYARLGELGLPKEQVYEIVYQQFGKRVSSLKQLGVHELERLYQYIFSMKR